MGKGSKVHLESESKQCSQGIHITNFAAGRNENHHRFVEFVESQWQVRNETLQQTVRALAVSGSEKPICHDSMRGKTTEKAVPT